MTTNKDYVPMALVWPHLPTRTRQMILAVSGIPYDGFVNRPWRSLPQGHQAVIVKQLRPLD